MKKLAAIIAITLLVSCASNDPFKKLDKLTGIWTMNTDQGPLYEEWSKQTNNSMYGKSYMINGTDSIVMEMVELKKQGDSVVFEPIVKGQNNDKPVSFKLVNSDTAFIFENKGHDFPQRVIYKFIGNDSIVARIEGKKDGQDGSVEYYYSRVKKP
jgi:hypothetical protein